MTWSYLSNDHLVFRCAKANAFNLVLNENYIKTELCTKETHEENHTHARCYYIRSIEQVVNIFICFPSKAQYLVGVVHSSLVRHIFVLDHNACNIKSPLSTGQKFKVNLKKFKVIIA